MGSKPVTRDRISLLLDEVLSKTAEDPELLSRVDREILAFHPPGRVAEAIRARAGRSSASRPTSSLRPLLVENP